MCVVTAQVDGTFYDGVYKSAAVQAPLVLGTAQGSAGDAVLELKCVRRFTFMSPLQPAGVAFVFHLSISVHMASCLVGLLVCRDTVVAQFNGAGSNQNIGYGLWIESSGVVRAFLLPLASRSCSHLCSYSCWCPVRRTSPPASGASAARAW